MRSPHLGLALVLAAGCAPAARPAEPEPAVPVAPDPSPADPKPVTLGAPWALASEWTGPGVPPKQFSLFDIPAGSPVLAYAALGRDACEAELGRRGIAFERGEPTAGVLAPVRLAGPLRAVTMHSMVPPKRRATSRKELIDCRLALSLDDLASDLVAHDIVDVEWSSAYRTKGELGCTTKYNGEQHCAAMAVDVTSFGKRDGTRLVVARDFHGKLGTLTCGAEPSNANELWSIACDAAGREFQVVLTPNWNTDHRDHLHLELTVHDWVLAR